MEENLDEIKARIAQRIATKFAVAPAVMGKPIIDFEMVGEMPEDCEDLTTRVIEELKRRGLSVAHLVRFSGTGFASHLGQVAGLVGAGAADAEVFSTDGYVVRAERRSIEATLEEMLAMVGDGFDVIVTEAFGYQPIQKIVVTRKAEEAMNLCLPAMVAYTGCKENDDYVFRWLDCENIAEIADFIENLLIKRENPVAASAKVPYFSGHLREGNLHQ